MTDLRRAADGHGRRCGELRRDSELGAHQRFVDSEFHWVQTDLDGVRRGPAGVRLLVRADVAVALWGVLDGQVVDALLRAQFGELSAVVGDAVSQLVADPNPTSATRGSATVAAAA